MRASHRRLAVIVVAAIATASSLLAGTASADCASDPDDPPLRLKIRSRTTGDGVYRQLFLGRVDRVRDPGAQGGAVTVRLRIRQVAIGDRRSVARVEDHAAPEGVWSSADFIFERGERYAVVAHRTRDGDFSYDGYCGQTARLSAFRFRQLVRMSRHS
ncbi:MAG TPA: hypothetical protein VLA82_02765 [Actinomycetota bacterium]|nr:hypothetical protein [Actinomycetota bacterium]